MIVPVLSPVAEVGTLPFLKQSAHPIFAHGEREREQGDERTKKVKIILIYKFKETYRMGK